MISVRWVDDPSRCERPVAAEQQLLMMRAGSGVYRDDPALRPDLQIKYVRAEPDPRMNDSQSSGTRDENDMSE